MPAVRITWLLQHDGSVTSTIESPSQSTSTALTPLAGSRLNCSPWNMTSGPSSSCSTCSVLPQQTTSPPSGKRLGGTGMGRGVTIRFVALMLASTRAPSHRGRRRPSKGSRTQPAGRGSRQPPRPTRRARSAGPDTARPVKTRPRRPSVHRTADRLSKDGPTR